MSRNKRDDTTGIACGSHFLHPSDSLSLSLLYLVLTFIYCIFFVFGCFLHRQVI